MRERSFICACVEPREISAKRFGPERERRIKLKNTTEAEREHDKKSRVEGCVCNIC